MLCLAEDISTELEENSSAALLRIPRAVRETNRVKDDAISLKGTVSGLLQRLEQVRQDLHSPELCSSLVAAIATAGNPGRSFMHLRLIPMVG